MSVGAAQAQLALGERLATAARALHPERAADLQPPTDAGAIGTLLTDLLDETPTNSTVWLVLVAVSTVLPDDATVQRLRRDLDLCTPGLRADVVLRHGLALMRERGNPDARLTLVEHEWVVVVGHVVQHELNTGIQRVLRSMLPLWVRDGRPIRCAGWAGQTSSLRELTPLESSRLLEWQRKRPHASAPSIDVVVPWGTTVLVPEVPSREECAVLAGLALHSNNRLVCIGYDCIPVLSADMLPYADPRSFVHFLALLKYADRVSCISETSAAEFRGFVSALSSQGLTGPQVGAVLLPVDVPASARSTQTQASQPPSITCIGSHEPRKNHLSVLYAAETLWREGLQFSLRLIGGSGWDSGDGFAERLEELLAAGRQVRADRSVADDELWQSLRASRFTVFTSLHEGYGLPVAESLALGVPVITSNYGSMAEIAAGGGTLEIDPRDDDALVSTMRRLLTDDNLVATLRAEALARPVRGWQQYADELWADLGGEGS